MIQLMLLQIQFHEGLQRHPEDLSMGRMWGHWYFGLCDVPWRGWFFKEFPLIYIALVELVGISITIGIHLMIMNWSRRGFWLITDIGTVSSTMHILPLVRRQAVLVN